jgi:hypothetical protein
MIKYNFTKIFLKSWIDSDLIFMQFKCHLMEYQMTLKISYYFDNI